MPKFSHIKRVTSLIVLLFLSSIASKSLAQNSEFKFINKKRKKVVIPFKLVNNLMVVPLRINGSDTLNFILDTGVSKTIMTNLYFEGSLMLNKAKDIKLAGLGAGESISAIKSTENVVFMNGIIGDQQEIYVLLDDIFFLSTSMGMQIHGLIGYGIFKNFVVEIDYKKTQMVLYRPEQYEYKGKGERFRLSIQRAKPYVDAIAYQRNDSTQRVIKTAVKLLIDTGASHGLSLYDYQDNRIMIPQKSFRSYLGRGLNGDVYGQIGRLQGFELGNFSFENPVVTYPDKEAIAIAMKLSDRSGSIGADLMKRFKVVMNYSKKEMILIKNNFYKLPFNYNMSGIEVGTPVPGLKYYKVAQVRPNSPADSMGIKRGDDIISVNGVLASQLELNDLIEVFQGKAKKKIRLRLMRDEKILKFEIILKELI